MQKREGAFLYLAEARMEAQQSNEDGRKSFDLCNPATLPSGLNALYFKSFKRRFPDAVTDPENPGTRWNALVKPLLGYILASPEPLPLDLARELMGWDIDSAGDEKQHKTLEALGSLIKRTGNVMQPETCSLAPFHNSVREWLSTESAGAFCTFAEKSIYPLAEATWKRYLRCKQDDAYAWQVLPSLFPKVSGEELDELLGAPDWETSQILYRFADSMAPKLRFTDALDMWSARARYSLRLSDSKPEDAEFARDLFVSFSRLGDTHVSLGRTDEALGYYQRCLKIAEDLAARAPENAEFARDLSVSFNNLGDTHVSLGRTDEALGYYQRCLKIRDDLAARAPENAEFARDLWVSYWRFGSMTKGDSQMQWWKKVHSNLTSMKSRGILAKDDEKYLEVVKIRLGLD